MGQKPIDNKKFEECMRLINSGKSQKEAYETVGISKTTFRRYYNLYYNKKKVDYDSTKKLYEEWKVSKISLTNFAKKKHLNRYDMVNKFKECNFDTGLLHNKTYCDEYVFDTINEESAYWLGFLLADGYIDKDYKLIELSLKDKEHVEKFKKFMKSEHNIKQRVIKSNNSTVYRIMIGSVYLCDRLKHLGFISNKTYIPTIISYEVYNSPYLKDFIRGYFEGDGNLMLEKGQRSTGLRMTSYSINDLNILKECIKKATNIEFKIYESKDRAPSMVIYKERYEFCNWIYKDCTTYLDRKYDIYKKYFCRPD